jgi:hypothetical protein
MQKAIEPFLETHVLNWICRFIPHTRETTLKLLFWNTTIGSRLNMLHKNVLFFDQNMKLLNRFSEQVPKRKYRPPKSITSLSLVTIGIM